MCLLVQSVPKNSNEINEWHPVLASMCPCGIITWGFSWWCPHPEWLVMNEQVCVECLIQGHFQMKLTPSVDCQDPLLPSWDMNLEKNVNMSGAKRKHRVLLQFPSASPRHLIKRWAFRKKSLLPCKPIMSTGTFLSPLTHKLCTLGR